MDSFFRYLNIFPLPLWLLMIVAPGHPLTERVGRSSTIFSLAAAHYVVTLIIAIKYDLNKRAGNSDSRNLNFTSLEGIRAILSSRSGTLAAWGHMLALDLFTGAWIYRQCRRLNAPNWIRIVSLFFTFATGPLGLLIFLFWRVVGTKEGEALVNRHE